MASSGKLAPAFLPHLAAGSPLASRESLEDELRARLDAGRAAWPAVALDAAAFMRHLAERSAAELPSLERAADLYLACACALGDTQALDAFHRGLRADVVRAVGRGGESSAFLDEVAQVLSVKLFVGAEGAPPAIGAYEGRASLRGWLATAARRTAFNLRRRKDDRSHDEVRSGVAALGSAAGPELALLKAQYKADFEEAIRAALAAMPDKQRTLLLLHLVEGVTLAQLAAMQKISRATVARWLAAARETLQEETVRQLTGRLRVPPSELESILALVRSQLEVSLAAVVAADEAKGR
jgi:RNA polymerase sigma-70 factor (ECF subfamily)